MLVEKPCTTLENTIETARCLKPLKIYENTRKGPKTEKTKHGLPSLHQVGMAAQKGTVERLRQSGVGALSNAFGMAAFLGQKYRGQKNTGTMLHLGLHSALWNMIVCLFFLVVFLGNSLIFRNSSKLRCFRGSFC